jgi:hypothetical protein
MLFKIRIEEQRAYPFTESYTYKDIKIVTKKNNNNNNNKTTHIINIFLKMITFLYISHKEYMLDLHLDM